MDIFFQDPNDIPLPPDEVRIRQFTAEPWRDGRRVRVRLELTPFLKRPNGEIRITDSHGAEAASISIIETMQPNLELTMHLRGSQLKGPYTASAVVFYLEEPVEAGDRNPEAVNPEGNPDSRQQIVVDRAETIFEVLPEGESRTSEDEG